MPFSRLRRHPLRIPLPVNKQSLLSSAMNLQVGFPDSSSKARADLLPNADLDSITSSIVYAYLRVPGSSKSPPFIPLLNIPRADVQIRPELLALLPHANIDSAHLITTDDVPILSSSSSEQLHPTGTQWILTDHNKLPGELGQRYSTRVIGCIDHHVDEQTIPITEDEPRIIQKCGSCTSLVVNHCRPAWDALSSSASSSGASNSQTDMGVGMDDEAVRRTWDAQIAKLALGAILIDTQNLNSMSKVTKDDTDAVKYLMAKIGLSRGSTAFDRHAFYEQINAAKSNLDEIDLPGLLRKDYKQWEVRGRQLGISSIVQPLSYLEKRSEPLIETIQKFVKERHLSIFAIMTASSSDTGDFQRELLLLDDTGAGISTKFAQATKDELQLRDIQVSENAYQLPADSNAILNVWRQGSLDLSRKKVGPLLRESMA